MLETRILAEKRRPECASKMMLGSTLFHAVPWRDLDGTEDASHMCVSFRCDFNRHADGDVGYGRSLKCPSAS